MNPRLRYERAHAQHFARIYPAAYKDHGCPRPVWPRIQTSNGLTTFIINFMNWQGANMKRQNTTGRMIGKLTRATNGGYFDDRRFIKSASGRGGSDCRGTFMGRAISLEIKIGKDKPSDHQLAEQSRE